MLHNIIKKPLVTEKSSMERAKNKYFFMVSRSANKAEVKKAVQEAFKVKVTSVNIINVKGKKRRYGKVEGRTKDRKKAMVTLQKGHTIEALSA